MRHKIIATTAMAALVIGGCAAIGYIANQMMPGDANHDGRILFLTMMAACFSGPVIFMSLSIWELI